MDPSVAYYAERLSRSQDVDILAEKQQSAASASRDDSDGFTAEVAAAVPVEPQPHALDVDTIDRGQGPDTPVDAADHLDKEGRWVVADMLTEEKPLFESAAADDANRLRDVDMISGEGKPVRRIAPTPVPPEQRPSNNPFVGADLESGEPDDEYFPEDPKSDDEFDPHDDRYKDNDSNHAADFELPGEPLGPRDREFKNPDGTYSVYRYVRDMTAEEKALSDAQREALEARLQDEKDAKVVAAVEADERRQENIRRRNLRMGMIIDWRMQEVYELGEYLDYDPIDCTDSFRNDENALQEEVKCIHGDILKWEEIGKDGKIVVRSAHITPTQRKMMDRENENENRVCECVRCKARRKNQAYIQSTIKELEQESE